MIDPSLFDMMHGVTSKKKKKIDKNSEDPVIEETIQREVDRLMAEEDPTANQLLPKEAKRAKIEQEVRAFADHTEFGKYIASAYSIFETEVTEDQTLQKSLSELKKKLNQLDLKEELSDEKLQAILALPEEVQNSILKIGITKFTEEKFEESLAVFTFLTAVADEEPDYWYRLGLVAQKAGHLDLAINALKTVSDLAPDFIGAHLYEAECYLNNGMINEAKLELDEAKKCFHTTDEKEKWRDQMFEIEDLIKTTLKNA